MSGTVAILWAVHGRLHSGSLESRFDRLELRSRGRTLSIPFTSISRSGIERGPSSRINGLPVLSLRLRDESVVRIASLQGAGVLHELASELASARVSPAERAGPRRPPSSPIPATTRR
jgi:hypothetical protein